MIANAPTICKRLLLYALARAEQERYDSQALSIQHIVEREITAKGKIDSKAPNSLADKFYGLGGG